MSEPIQPLRIVALSGSLRALSYNTALLEACATLAPAAMQVEVFGQVGELPLFNPDLDQYAFDAVNALRSALRAADGVIFASPEYAHGITGVMKNAIDWMVNDEALVHKPVVLLNASPRATIAQAALREVISTVSARICEEASIALPVIGSRLDARGIAEHPEMAGDIRAALGAFAHFIESQRAGA